MKANCWTVASLILFLGVAACGGARRPVVYPNEHVREVGDQRVARDIDDCLNRADQYISSGRADGEVAADVAEDAAVGAATGAATGAAGGAVVGDAGRGAAVGAASGATAGFMHGFFRSRRKGPSQTYKNFVERCLRERGYDPIGWD